MANYNVSDREKKYTTGFDQKLANGYDTTSGKNAEGTLSAIADRISKPFEYDINGDALYQQYKDSYTKQGQLAMRDSIGKASAMTGGYGNSYAQQVGQQTFNGYMSALNDKIPELYALAYDKHRQETSDLFDLYGLYKVDDETKYGRHMDELSLYSGEIGREQSQNWNKANLQAQNEANQAAVTAAQIKADAEAVNEMSPAEFIELISHIDAMRTDGGWDKDTASQFLLGYAAQNGITGDAFNPILNLWDWDANTEWRGDYRTNMSELARLKQSK